MAGNSISSGAKATIGWIWTALLGLMALTSLTAPTQPAGWIIGLGFATGAVIANPASIGWARSRRAAQGKPSRALSQGILGVVVALVIAPLASAVAMVGASHSNTPGVSERGVTDAPSSSIGYPTQGGEPSQLDKARILARRDLMAVLKDAESARIADARAYRNNDTFVFCGRVNSRNSFGGYSGFREFFVAPTKFAVVAEGSDGTSTFAAMAGQFCTPDRLEGPTPNF